MSGYDAWKTTDPSLEEDGCPLCDAEVEGDKYSVWCTECDWNYEADYESIIRDKEDYKWGELF